MAEELTARLEKIYDMAARTVLLVLAGIACLGALWRILSSNKEVLNHLDGTTLLYLGIAGALVLLREIKSLSFGDYKVEFERVYAIAREAKNTAENAQSAAFGIGKQVSLEEIRSTTAAKEILPGTVPGDPWKGQFGGKSVNNNRQLEAEVSRIPGSADLFSVWLGVQSTLPKHDPLRGVVQFFLHPTFHNDRPIVTVGPNGVAELKLTAWGAFTVGALVDDGRTQLELDLAQLESAPFEFRSR